MTAGGECGIVRPWMRMSSAGLALRGCGLK
nr:MAG TPA: hypothetical protein [Caudoviricetes sp.]